MPYDLIHVIAGSPSEAREWAEKVGLKIHQWAYMYDTKTCEGHWRTSRFAAVGTYRSRLDYWKLDLFVSVIKPSFARGWEWNREGL